MGIGETLQGRLQPSYASSKVVSCTPPCLRNTIWTIQKCKHPLLTSGKSSILQNSKNEFSNSKSTTDLEGTGHSPAPLSAPHDLLSLSAELVSRAVCIKLPLKEASQQRISEGKSFPPEDACEAQVQAGVLLQRGPRVPRHGAQCALPTHRRMAGIFPAASRSHPWAPVNILSLEEVPSRPPC